MTPSEIISQDIQAHGHNPERVLRWVAGHVHRHNAILLQHGNSVLLVKKIAPHQVELHLFTRDKPLALVGAIKDFYEKIKKSDIKKMYGKADNPQIVQLMKTAGVKVQNSDKPQYNWMGVVKE
jgi:hypothetical protein